MMLYIHTDCQSAATEFT